MQSIGYLLVTFALAAPLCAQRREQYPPPPTAPSTSAAVAARVQEHIERASVLFREHKLNEALIEANEALRLDPNSPSAQAFMRLVTMAQQMADEPKPKAPGALQPPAVLTSPGEVRRQSHVVLEKDTLIILRLSADVSSDSRPEPAPRVQVFQDVKVGDLIVVAKGSPILYAIEKDSAGDETKPGSVVLSFGSVRSITGDEVRLVGMQGAVGDRWTAADAGECGMCVPIAYLLSHLLRGNPGQIKGGTLLYARVVRDIELDKPALEGLNRALVEYRAATPKNGLGKARLHFYTDKVTPSSQTQQINVGVSLGVGIRIDGTRAGSLNPPQYACAEIEPGLHLIKVGKQTFQLMLEGRKDYFLFIQFILGEAYTYTTDRYQSVGGTPISGSLRKPFGVDCWDEFAEGYPPR